MKAGAVTLLLSLIACTSTPSDPPPVEVIAGDGQQATVGATVAISPRVRIHNTSGDILPGVMVHFTVVSGGGTVSGDSVVTDTKGEAAVGQWRLGTRAGGNTLRVSAAGVNATATVSATGLAGAPSAMRAPGGVLLLTVVGQPVTPAPTVLVTDVYDNPVPGIKVTFDKTTTDGFVSSNTSTTDAHGVAQSSRWVIGGAIGENQATAHSPGLSVNFRVQGIAVAPVIIAQSTTTQTGLVSFPVPAIPRVIVQDVLGHALPNIPVRFSLASGDAATLTGEFATTNLNGMASPDDWRLSASAAASVVTAEIPGLNGTLVHFTATGAPQPPFVIDLRFLSTMGAAQRDAFVGAALRWMRVITGSLIPTPVNLSAGSCAAGFTPEITEVIPSVVIFASVAEIDGPNGILAFSGPCVTRTGSQLPLVGSMTFDDADLQSLVVSNQIEAVVTHEMGHVLGFGTIWYTPQLTQGIGGPDPIFIGPSALGLWPTFTLLGYTGAPVPLENLFGPGTRDSHWRESVFHAELMTGFIENVGVPMPLSKMTIAAMADLGYQVDFSAGDPFAGNLLAPGGGGGAGKVRLGESLLTPVAEVSPNGVMRRFVKR